MRAILIAVTTGAVVAISCTPSNVVPTSDTHPANPSAKAPGPRAGSTTLAVHVPGPERDDVLGDSHGGHDMGANGNDAGGHDHGAHDHGTHEMPADPAKAELAAYDKAKPVFAEHCAGCHTTAEAGDSKKGKKAMKHFVMDRYPFGGHHADELGVTIRESLGVDGGKPTMPKDDPGAVQGDQLAAIVAWTHAFDKTHPAGKGGHDHGGHDHGAKDEPTDKSGHDHGGHDH